MRNDQTDSPEDGSAADGEPRRPAVSGGTFPTHAVVGIIDDPRELAKAVAEMRAGGFDPHVLHGERGEQRIRQAGDVPRDLTLTRFAQGVFGYEAEHTERHVQEVEDGNFVLIVESHDDETTERARDIFAAHGGHFVNYYSTWTSQSLAP
jgi:hypothetical protein